MILKSIFLLFFSSLIAISDLQGAFTIKDGKFVNADLVPTMPVEDHYSAGTAAYQEGKWNSAAYHFAIVANNFPGSPYAQESNFYLAVAYYNQAEYDMANDAFTAYLQGSDHPRLFIEAMEYKFAIAEKFRLGARRRLLGTKQLPKWATGGTLAVSIYDEVIAAMPCNELAARSLYSKALLHKSKREYIECIDCLQMGIRRFPKHELTPELFLLVNKIYLEQCRYEFQNPDLLAFAELNLRRFQQQFPREERLAQAERDVLAIKEVYGTGLLQTGYFYERVRKPSAAVLYYQCAIKQFPETVAAAKSRERLVILNVPLPSPEEPKQTATNLDKSTEKSENTTPQSENKVAENIPTDTMDTSSSKENIDWIP
jgi:outer membrane protein assembly factor BamD (BamD/ComL family)